MNEETKEEYLKRLRQERGLEASDYEEQEQEPVAPKGLKARLKGLLFLLLLALFLWAILQIFGMLKGN